MTGVQIVGIACAEHWWVLGQTREGAWRRHPLAAFGLVRDDPTSATYVVGLEASDGVELARVGRYVHTDQLIACRCPTPTVEQLDPTFCAYCAGTLEVGR